MKHTLLLTLIASLLAMPSSSPAKDVSARRLCRHRHHHHHYHHHHHGHYHYQVK
jgi:hypothetical protein